MGREEERERDRRKERERTDKDVDRERERERDRKRERERGEKERDRERERSRERERERDTDREKYREKGREREKERSPASKDETPRKAAKSEEGEEGEMPQASGGGDISLSVEATNALRAKLGLKPLDMGPSKQVQEAERWREMKETAEKDKEAKEIMDRIMMSKQKRAMEKKLKSSKGLAEDDDDVDVLDWVQQSRQKQKDLEKAAKQAKMFEELDEDFGVGALVANNIKEETEKQKAFAYSAQNLSGLKVEHDISDLVEGGQTILTIKDSNVLDDEEDTLVNVNLVDVERARENIENKKKKPTYQAYDDGNEFDQDGNPKKATILGQYDEELEGKKKKAFLLGAGDVMVDKDEAEKKRIGEALRAKAINLMTVPSVIRSDTYTKEEVVGFRKTNRKKKIIKKKEKVLKAGDLVPLDEGDKQDHRSRKYRTKSTDEEPIAVSKTEGGGEDIVIDEDDITPIIAHIPRVIDEDANEADDLELQLTLERAKRLKERYLLGGMNGDVERLAARVNAKRENSGETTNHFDGTNTVTISATVERARTIGDVPKFEVAPLAPIGQSTNGTSTQGTNDTIETMEVEDNDQIDLEKEDIPPISTKKETFGMIEERLVSGGLAAALAVAHMKGYIAPGQQDDSEGGMVLIEDDRRKALRKEQSLDDRTEREKDRDKYRHRARERNLAEQDRERDRQRSDREREVRNRGVDKADYKPHFNLDYFDDTGRKLDAKEAFRQLSHKFHGKMPGKNKLEKQLRKRAEELSLLKMSTGDTPLNTVQKMVSKQEETGCAFLVLSGGSKNQPSNSIDIMKQKDDKGKLTKGKKSEKKKHKN